MADDFATAAFDAQDQLLAILAGCGLGRDWTIDYGLPPIRTDRHAWVDETVDDWSQDLLTTGVPSSTETFALHVYLYVRGTGASALELRQLLREAAGRFAAGLAVDVTLGGVLQVAQVAGAGLDSAFADPEGRVRESVLRVDVGCSAWLV